MIHISDKRNCAGCTACMVACPKNAISMVVTNSEFTRAAETLAEENDVKLIPCVKQK